MATDDFDKILAELLEDPATAEAYNRRKPAYDVASQLIARRSGLVSPRRAG